MVDMTTSKPLHFDRNEGTHQHDCLIFTKLKSTINCLSILPVPQFANHIQSESPPSDTFSLTSKPDDFIDPVDHDYSSIVLPDIEDDNDDNHIISITTDSTYKSTSDYAEASHSDAKFNQTTNSNAISTQDHRYQSLTSLFPSLSTRSPQHSITTVGQSTFSTTSRLPSLTTTSSTTETSFGHDQGLFGSLFDLFDMPDDMHQYYEQTTIPPFRKITSLVSLDDIMKLSSDAHRTTTGNSMTESIPPQRINDKVFDDEIGSMSTTPKNMAPSTTTTIPSTTTTTTPTTTHRPITSSTLSSSSSSTPTPISHSDGDKLADLNILRDALLGSLSNTDSLQLPITSSRHPIYQGSVPFLSPIFQAQSHTDRNAAVSGDSHNDHPFSNQHNQIRNDLDLILSGLPSQPPISTKPTFAQPASLPEYSSPVPGRRPEYAVHNGVYAVDPVVASTAHTFEGAAQIFTKPVQSSSSVGMLKLAGCNIYGRMYRVGRIISELSSECLECRCTEVGVNCTPLEC